MRQLSHQFFSQKRVLLEIKNFQSIKASTSEMREREQYVVMQSSVISHFQEVLTYCVTNTFQSKGQIFSCLSSFNFESRVDFNMAEFFIFYDRRPPSGYEEDFVEEVEEDFQCPICHLPLKEPVLTRCGHRYCKECLDQRIER